MLFPLVIGVVAGVALGKYLTDKKSKSKSNEKKESDANEKKENLLIGINKDDTFKGNCMDDVAKTNENEKEYWRVFNRVNPDCAKPQLAEEPIPLQSDVPKNTMLESKIEVSGEIRN